MLQVFKSWFYNSIILFRQNTVRDLKMNFQKVFAICYVSVWQFCICSVAIDQYPEELGIYEFYKTFQGLQKTGDLSCFCVGSSEEVQFVKVCFAADPLGCLELVYSFNDFFFEIVFFDLLSFKHAFYFPYLLSTSFGFTDISGTCNKIKDIVVEQLAKTCNSEDEKIKRSQSIKQLIKFVKRNMERPIQSWPEDRVEWLHKQSDEIESWQFVMNILPITQPNEPMDYFHFFSTFNEFFRIEGASHQSRVKSKYHLHFAIYLERFISEKDTKLFEINHYLMPFLAGLILKNINHLGKNIFPGEILDFHHFCHAGNHLGKLLSLRNVIKEKITIINRAKESLGLKSCDILLSQLVVGLEKFPLESRKKDYPNLLWQLKGLALIHTFLETSKFRKRLDVPKLF
jgi:hypothetical protein